MPIRKFIRFLMFTLMSIVITGCALSDAKEIRSAASIIDKGSGWKITHSHDNSTGEKKDMLESKDMTVWIRFYRPKDNNYFRVTTHFMKVRYPIEFSPSHITLKFSNGDTVKGKAVSCYNEKWDLESLRGYSPAEEPIHVNKDESRSWIGKPCYSLFFDCPVPPVEEEFIIFMNDALISDGMKINVPPIYFRKSVDYNFRFGLSQ